MSRAYYNENDPKAAAWLRELIKAGLIAAGDVDERSITDVQPNDLEPYTQCHFFAGIGGWSYALRLAGVPDSYRLWSGSCPCQPWSYAGDGLGELDPRHLWPSWFRLIKERNPAIIVGEQVASEIALRWLDGVFNDLEGEDYSCAAADLCAASVKAPNVRQRLWWVAHSSGHGCEGIQRCLETQISKDRAPEALGAWNRPGDPFSEWEKLLAGTCVRRLADGVSSNLVVRPALRGFGNAINPIIAAEFIQASFEAIASLTANHSTPSSNL